MKMQNACSDAPCAAKGDVCVDDSLQPDTVYPLALRTGFTLGHVDFDPLFSISFKLRLNRAVNKMTNIITFGYEINVLRFSSTIELRGDKRIFTSKSLRFRTWLQIRVESFACAYAKNCISLQIDGEDVDQSPTEISSGDLKRTQIFVSSPDSPAAFAEIKDLRTSNNIAKPGYECKFDKDTCPSNAQMTKKVKWRGIKGHKIMETGPGAVMLSVKIKNQITTFLNIRENPYTGFLYFGKKKCGEDFLNAFIDGRLSFVMMDKEKYASAIYDVSYRYKRTDKSLTASILQFRQNAKPDTNLNLKKGKKVEEIHVIIKGLDKVNFGSKDMYECIQKPQVAVMKDETSDDGRIDWTKCVAWSKNLV